MGIDVAGVEKAVRDLLVAVGEDPNREGLVQTPQRVARAYQELLGGLDTDPARHLRTRFTVETDQLVLVRDIGFHSLCEHHLLPFYGRAHVAYLPSDNQVTGLSKLARTVEEYARRLQVQERLTMLIAQALQAELSPSGCAVIVEAEHMCMTMRGVQKPGASTITEAFFGQLDTPQWRSHLLELTTGAARS